jgi:hypothetical protein
MTQTLGYLFHPPIDARALGHDGLDFSLYDQPTLAHFDPEHATVIAVQSNGGVGSTVLAHPWGGPEVLRLCAGHVTLRDRRNHTIQAFSLGGQLTVTNQGTFTACRLVSPAPVFELAPAPGLDAGDVEVMLVEELTGLFARRSAHWAGDPGEYQRRLAAADPVVLYAVALATIDARLDGIPFDRRPEPYRLTGTAIHEEIRRLQQASRWPSPLPALDDVL